MSQPKINPGHPVTHPKEPSDSMSAIGCGKATKGEGHGIRTTSHALNHGEAKGYGVGAMGRGRPRPVTRSPGD